MHCLRDVVIKFFLSVSISSASLLNLVILGRETIMWYPDCDQMKEAERRGNREFENPSFGRWRSVKN